MPMRTPAISAELVGVYAKLRTYHSWGLPQFLNLKLLLIKGEF